MRLGALDVPRVGLRVTYREEDCLTPFAASGRGVGSEGALTLGLNSVGAVGLLPQASCVATSRCPGTALSDATSRGAMLTIVVAWASVRRGPVSAPVLRAVR